MLLPEGSRLFPDAIGQPFTGGTGRNAPSTMVIFIALAKSQAAKRQPG
jgi:hypothetical protein